MGKYKLIALDMDGTLLTEDKTISAENKAAIADAAEAGITVMFATGRGIQNVLGYADELGLQSPIVTVNGSEVWSAPERLHLRHEMDAELVVRMREIALQRDTWYWAYSVDGVHNRDNWPKEASAFQAKQWLKFGYYCEDVQRLSGIQRELESWGLFEVTNSHPYNIELNPQGVNKASGLAEVCGLLGIQMSEVIAAGDSLNDAAMLQAAGFGVAMGNAQDEVKQLADAVTASNEEHGVAQLIRRYVLS